MHLHNKVGFSVVISPENSKITEKLLDFGINLIPTIPIDNLIHYERYHADMQLLIINDTAFVAGDSEYLHDVLQQHRYRVVASENLKGNYPGNVSLNAALVGDKLFCKVSALSSYVKEYCEINNIRIIDVNQGYTKCSTLVLNKNAIITADKGIYNKAVCSGVDALLISAGFIELKGADCGFIGGSSCVIGDMVVFFGDIGTHPDSEMISEFIHSYELKCISLTEGSLVDIGGAVVL